MSDSKIKNVVFDIGNVVVRWSPLEIIRLAFGELETPELNAKQVFHNSIWMELNKGLLTEEQAKARYQEELSLSQLECDKLFYYVKQTQILIYGSVELIKRVKATGYAVYALTDNVVEIVEHLKSTYDFWPLFDGTIVSAEHQLLKPQPEIYEKLLSEYQLNASETVFIDDMPYNVLGAENAGISGIQFENAEQCVKELQRLGVSI